MIKKSQKTMQVISVIINSNPASTKCLKVSNKRLHLLTNFSMQRKIDRNKCPFPDIPQIHKIYQYIYATNKIPFSCGKFLMKV